MITVEDEDRKASMVEDRLQEARRALNLSQILLKSSDKESLGQSNFPKVPLLKLQNIVAEAK